MGVTRTQLQTLSNVSFTTVYSFGTRDQKFKNSAILIWQISPLKPCYLMLDYLLVNLIGPINAPNWEFSQNDYQKLVRRMIKQEKKDT